MFTTSFPVTGLPPRRPGREESSNPGYPCSMVLWSTLGQGADNAIISTIRTSLPMQASSHAARGNLVAAPRVLGGTFCIVHFKMHAPELLVSTRLPSPSTSHSPLSPITFPRIHSANQVAKPRRSPPPAAAPGIHSSWGFDKLSPYYFVRAAAPAVVLECFLYTPLCSMQPVRLLPWAPPIRTSLRELHTLVSIMGTLPQGREKERGRTREGPCWAKTFQLQRRSLGYLASPCHHPSVMAYQQA